MKLAKTILASLVLLVLCGTVAFAMGLLNLPFDPVSSTHGSWNAGAMGSTIDITLAGVPDGYDVTDGTYAGWCLEDNHQHNLPPGALVTLFDSTDDPLNFPAGSGYDLIEWDKINYLLNNKSGSIEDVQVAVWLLTGTYDGTFSLTAAAQAMHDDAELNGGGFVPATGQVVGVLLYGDGFGPDGHQDTVIEVPLPPDDTGDSCTPGYWRNTRKKISDWYAAGYYPEDSFDAAMGYCVTTGLTMEQAVNQRGGQEGKIIRFGAASLLNAGHPVLDHGLTTEEVQAMFCNGYHAGEWSVFDGYYDGEQCPL